MIRSNNGFTCAVLAVALVVSNCAVAKTIAKEPTGAERARQYAKAVDWCRKRYGGQAGDVTAQWAPYDGHMGWVCFGRRS